jgi:hypothetical protein
MGMPKSDIPVFFMALSLTESSSRCRKDGLKPIRALPIELIALYLIGIFMRPNDWLSWQGDFDPDDTLLQAKFQKARR